MSDLAMQQVAELVHKVAGDVRRMGDMTTEQSTQMLSALDDLAATIMALKAVAAAQLKVTPVDPTAVHAWIDTNMDPAGEGTDKARAVVDDLLQAQS
ncbi:hypothetical protein [Roseospira goensis]|uniref:Polyhydroxyalkanoate synthesis regulator phasin n=1 Tax=Roseospira goensis TaxID=391922 RepID=A0A7W6S2A6_9PROT|nr:hypothetical protein [Roseospira goensis]MBB4286869.1 polyhydroxyalkanoate synthesis regulator phasin [Roseospira goensis]